MTPTKIISVFRLSFWWESNQEKVGYWRGRVWHDELKEDETPLAVRSPEEAFEIVLKMLAQRAKARAAINGRSGFEQNGRHTNYSEGGRHRVKNIRVLASLWRKLLG